MGQLEHLNERHYTECSTLCYHLLHNNTPELTCYLACTLAGAANSQEWHQICALITAPIPCLQSRLLTADAATSICEPVPRFLHALFCISCSLWGQQVGRVPNLHCRSPTGCICPPAASEGGLAERDTQPLQQLLLEGVANDSVRDSADVGRLVCSTFAAHQQGRAGGGPDACTCMVCRADTSMCV